MMETITVRKDEDPRLSGVLVCVVQATVEAIGPSPAALVTLLDELVARRSVEDYPPEALKNAVRDALRLGGFKPAGRQKPSSEYLAQAARDGRFPSINGPVDCNNYLSLDTGLPISMLDADELGSEVLVRVAGAGESYVFNGSGQEMDLSGLFCVCRADGTPLGNPVKDSMAGKIKDGSRRLAGYIYGTPALYTPTSLFAVGERFAALLRDYCCAKAEVAVVV